MIVANRSAVRAPYAAELRRIMNIQTARESGRWLAHWSMQNPGATPVWQLPGLAQRLSLQRISVKDESKRSPLGSFKALGAPVALLRLIIRRWPEHDFAPRDLLAGSHAGELRDLVVITATDGNHGRALAAAAQSIGCRCVIVLHRRVSSEREAAIAAHGAEIVRVAGNYDDSVREAARLASANGWQVVSDTSYEGYEEIPRDVMQGYGVIVDELLEEPVVEESDECPYTHAIVQGGVGGLAAGIVSYFTERYGARRPAFVVVEPREADCLYQSAIAGVPSHASGSVDSVMAGLACGQTSPLAWRFLQPTVDFFMTIPDEQAVAAMRVLSAGSEEEAPILAGESGAAGLGALLMLAEAPQMRRQTGLGAGSDVLLINTEGATAPATYRELTGRSADSVLEAQALWCRERATRGGEIHL